MPAREPWSDRLGDALINGDVPWDSAQETTVDRFLEEYTLHDSEWVGLWSVPGSGVIAILRWDPLWQNRGKKRMDFGFDDPDAPQTEQGAWPLLLIRFPTTYTVSHSPVVGGADLDSLIILAASCDKTPDQAQTSGADCSPGYEVRDSAAVRTVVESTNRYTVTIVHDPRLEVLCLGVSGRLVTIPDL